MWEWTEDGLESEPFEGGGEPSDYDAFEVDTGGEMDAPIAQAGFVIVGKLDHKTRMYIRLFAAGPPMNCDPMLN
jgi:hypothetical protein